MEHNNKRIAKNAIALFMRMFIIAILGLVSSRLMLRTLGEIDFGIYSVVGGAVTMMAFFNTVLASSTNRFMVIELGKGKNGDMSKIFSVSMTIHALMGIFALIIGESIGLYYIYNYINVPIDKLTDTLFVYHVSLISSCLCVLQVPFQALLVSYENFTRFSIVQIVVTTCILISSLLLIWFPTFHLREFGFFMALSQIVGLVLYYLLSIKYMPNFRIIKEKNIYKQITTFSIWIAFGAASTIGKGQGSNLVLNYYFNPIVNSAFSIAHQVNVQLSHLGENISKAFSPQIMKAYVQNEQERLIQLICASSKYSFFLLYLVALPFILETDFILTLWLGEYPEFTGLFCQLMIICSLILICNQGIHPAVQATGKIKWFQIILSLLSLATIPFACILFMLGCSPYTLSIAYIVSAIVSLIARQIMLKRILYMPIKEFITKIYLRAIYVVGCTFPLFFLGNICPQGWTHFFLFCILSLIANVLAIYFVGLESYEKKRVQQYIMHRIYKVKHEK